jgi:hypothetical protein
MRLQVRENLWHNRFGRMMFKVYGDSRTLHTEFAIPPTLAHRAPEIAQNWSRLPCFEKVDILVGNARYACYEQ